MSTTPTASVPARPTAARSGARSGAAAQRPVARTSGDLQPQSAPTAAAVIAVSPAVVRRHGAEAALVWSAIEAGRHEYLAICEATGLRVTVVRAAWARLGRSGFALPSNTPIE